MWFGVTPPTRAPITASTPNPPAGAKTKTKCLLCIPGNKLVYGVIVKRKEARFAEFVLSCQIPTSPCFKGSKHTEDTDVSS